VTAAVEADRILMTDIQRKQGFGPEGLSGKDDRL
jgi:hypothetical protein